MIEGVSHITFVVRDLEKSASFLRTLFDAQEVYSSGSQTYSLSREKFFLIGQTWIALMKGDCIEKSYNHVAFKISDTDFDIHLKRIKEYGVEIRTPRPRVAGEGRSIYFYDFDNHLFELHTGTLKQRLERYTAKSGAEMAAV